MSHDDFAFEPVKGLPELPPEGERILWQGRPDTRALSWQSLSLPWVGGYFMVLAAWRLLSVIDQVTLTRAVAMALPFVIMGAVVCLLLLVVGIVQARSTVYTITNRRVAMRIGAALTITLNLPFTRIGSADLRCGPRGTGTIALDLMGEERLSYLLCWPHVRPWMMRRTQPALRCIPDAARVARILSDAAEARVSQPQVTRLPTPVAVAAE